MCINEITQAVQEWESKLLSYAFSFLKDQAASEDAVQEAFIKYLKALRGNPAEILTPSAWLFRVTRNICLDVIRSAERRQETALDEEQAAEQYASFEAPDLESARTDEVRAMRQFVQTLPAREQEILSLKFEYAKSYREIAEVMNLSASNVGYLLCQTMKKVRSAYDRMNQGTEVAQ